MVEFPDKDELVMVIIRKIMPYGAFCILPEYNNMEAFLHVSEIAPRWIKNIHEFISEGQQHVAKIYRLDREKNQVDISLKRVSEEEKKRKLELIRTEKRSGKLLGLAIKNSGLKVNQNEIKDAIERQFEDVWSALLDAQENGEGVFKDVEIPKELKTEIAEVAKKYIKQPTVEVGGTISLTCWAVEGVEDVKRILSVKEKDLQIQYLGAPKYKITLSAPNYKDGQKTLSKIIERMEALAGKHNCDFSFEWS